MDTTIKCCISKLSMQVYFHLCIRFLPFQLDNSEFPRPRFRILCIMTWNGDLHELDRTFFHQFPLWTRREFLQVTHSRSVKDFQCVFPSCNWERSTFVPTMVIHLKSNCITMINSYGWNRFLTQEVNALFRVRTIINNISKTDHSITKNL